MAEWDVVSTAAAPAPSADPWAVVSHDAPAPSKLESLGHNLSESPVVGAGDLLLHHLTKALATVPGMVAGSGASVGKLFGADVDPDKVQADTEKYFTHQPVSQSGQAGLATEGAAGKAVSNFAAPVVQPIEAAGNAAINKTGAAAPYVRDLVHGVAGGVGNALQFSPLAPEGRAAASLADLAPAEREAFQARAPSSAAPTGPASGVTEGAAKPVVGTGADAIQTGRAAGFKFTPAAVESRQPAAALAGDIPKPLTGVSLEDRRAINLHNQALATTKAGEVLGLKGATDLPTAAFDKAKQPHFDTYKETGGVLGSGLTGSTDLVSALEAKIADTSPKTALAGPVIQNANRVINAAKSGNLSGPQLVNDISWFRANGGKSVANDLEDEMEKQLAATPPGSQQLDKFREARTGLAQVNTLQEASKGGQLNVAKLVKLDEKYPKLLTGNLKLLAQTGAAAPQDFRLPSGIAPGSSPVSKGLLQQVPLVGDATHAVLAGGKWLLNKAATKLAPGHFSPTSEEFQNRFGRQATPTEASYFQTLGKRPETPSQPFKLTPGPGTAGVAPVQRGMDLPQGAPAREQLGLTAPEGEVGVLPHQLGMQLAQGAPAREQLGLTHPEGTVGITPNQLGLEVAQGRPLSDQKLALKPSEGTLEPHQPSLLGHEGTPEGGSRAKKVKKRGKD